MTWQRGEGGGAPVRYEVRGGEEVLLTTGTSLRVARLAPARTACFAVTAIGETGLRSPQSAPGCAATLPDTTPPSAPAGLAAEARTREVLLRWQAARDDVAVAGYEVARGEKMVARSTELRAAEQEPGAGRHCYRVRAVDAAGNRSEPSPEACATTPDVAPPAAPSELAVEPGEAEVALSWKVPADDVGVAGYELWRDGALVARPSQPAAREAGLRPASRHCWQVAALDAAGNRSPLSTAACAVTLDRTPPTAPRGLAAAPDGAGVALSWSAATDQVGVAGYQVWRGAAEVARTTELRWADPGPMSSAESCYAVRAFDAAGNASPPSEQACARTPDTSPPSAPAELAAAPASATELVLAWAPATDNVGVVRYEVLRGDQKIASGPEPRAAEAKLAPLTEYCYTVRAFDAAGNGSPPARACARTADPALPAAPTVLEARRLAADELELRWRASPAPGAVYLVYWDGTKGAPGRAGNGARLFGETPLTALKVFGAPARQRHCYQVAARSGDKESPRTLPLCVEPAGRRP